MVIINILVFLWVCVAQQNSVQTILTVRYRVSQKNIFFCLTLYVCTTALNSIYWPNGLRINGERRAGPDQSQEMFIFNTVTLCFMTLLLIFVCLLYCRIKIQSLLDQQLMNVLLLLLNPSCGLSCWVVLIDVFPELKVLRCQESSLQVIVHIHHLSLHHININKILRQRCRHWVGLAADIDRSSSQLNMLQLQWPCSEPSSYDGNCRIILLKYFLNWIFIHLANIINTNRNFWFCPGSQWIHQIFMNWIFQTFCIRDLLYSLLTNMRLRNKTWRSISTSLSWSIIFYISPALLTGADTNVGVWHSGAA